MKARNRILQLGASGLLALLFLVAPQAYAGGSGGSSTSPGGETRGGSDDVEGIPLVAAEGFQITIEASKLEGLLGGIRGNGQIRFSPRPDGRVTVGLQGRFRVQLDARAVARGEVQVRYQGRTKDARVMKSRGRLILQQR